MHTEKHMTLFLQRFHLYMKAFGKAFSAQFIAVLVFMPLITLYEYKKSGIGDALYRDILQWTQLIIPLFSVLPSAFLFDSLLAQDGCELMLIGKKNKLVTETLKLSLPYAIAVCALYCVYIRMFDNMKLELLKILVICFFMLSLICLLELITHTVAVGLAVSVIYSCINMFFCKSEAVFPLFFTLLPADSRLLLTNVLPFFFIAVMLLFVSTLVKKFSNSLNQ